jgi:hypothetical protein
VSLAWKLNRLSAMAPAEIAWRARRALRASAERVGLFAADPPQRVQEPGAAVWLTDELAQLDIVAYRAAADRILAGEFNVFALRPAKLGFPPRWNCDPKTGREAPLRFGKTLDYRNERVVGDIKYLWEPSRHAELVTLAQAWRLTREERYAEGCRTLLESWLEQCPYALGPHWVSSLEHGVRLLNWALAWRLLGGAEAPVFASQGGHAFRERWLGSVYQHCHFISGHLSRHSSANNHLLGEFAGLLAASLTWPCWAESVHWREQALSEFEEQALLQNAEDGVNREQAVWYHHEVADMMIAIGLLVRASGRDFSPDYWRRLEAMLTYIASIMDASGAVPAFGDADDAILVRLNPDEHEGVYASLLAAGAVLFGRADFALKARRFDDKVRWLLGDAAAERFQSLRQDEARAPAPRRAFGDSGYYVLGGAFETPREIRLVFDAGPLGYRSIAAHGHADALSFTLSAGGRELLVDPGTYAYHTQKRWRDYFRGTAAHNTVRIDGVDQSTIGGAFLWLTHAQARVLAFESNEAGERIVAEHDGYERLPDPVLHRREVRLERSASTLTVVDELCCRGEHEVELFWHLAEHCDAAGRDNQFSIRSDDVELRMTLPAQARCEILRGSEEPIAGWRSLRFDERLATTTVRAALRIAGNTRLVTHLALRFLQSAPEKAASHAGPHAESCAGEQGASP